jgi:hypothetical protein
VDAKNNANFFQSCIGWHIQLFPILLFSCCECSDFGVTISIPGPRYSDLGMTAREHKANEFNGTILQKAISEDRQATICNIRQHSSSSMKLKIDTLQYGLAVNVLWYARYPHNSKY